MKTFTYHQNNSGGFFVGPKSVTIEAESAEDADRIAEEEGLVYFDGVENGQDCECCGDRWYRLGVDI